MCQRKCFPAYNKKIQTTHRWRLHDIPENVWSKAWCSSVAIESFPSQRIYLTNQGRRHIYVDSWPLPEGWEISRKPARTSITTGQKKGPNFFSKKKNRTLDISYNVSPEQRDRYAAFYHFRYHLNFWRQALWKVVQTIMKLRGQLTAWIKRQEEINAAMIWIQKNLNGWFGYHTIGNGTLQSKNTQM